MKLRNFVYALLLLTGIGIMGFKSHNEIPVKRPCNSLKMTNGKAYWYSYYNKGADKKLYITKVYNNNCNHCSAEITAAFKEWLILNDYENTVSSVNIDNLNDIEEAALEKRSDATIIKYKGYGYSIIKVEFAYKAD